jgi:histidyl-tRNA synthetase
MLLDLPDIGSVCSGGRYDDLAGLFTKQKLPGVGASLGLDRLLTAMEELKMVKGEATAAPVIVLQFSPDRLGEYQRMARALRGEGIGADVFLEAKKVGQQLQYAERRGFKIALIAGPDEFAQKVWKVKNLAMREEITVAEDLVISAVQAIIKGVKL